MPIIERHSDSLHLSTVEFAGRITLAELQAHNDERFTRRDILTADAFWSVSADTVFVDLTPGALDAHRERIRTQFRAARLPLIRRSAWMCLSSAAMPSVTRFLNNRAPNDGLFVIPRLVSSTAEAADWLLVPEEDLIDTLRNGRIVARYGCDAAAA